MNEKFVFIPDEDLNKNESDVLPENPSKASEPHISSGILKKIAIGFGVSCFAFGVLMLATGIAYDTYGEKESEFGSQIEEVIGKHNSVLMTDAQNYLDSEFADGRISKTDYESLSKNKSKLVSYKSYNYTTSSDELLVTAKLADGLLCASTSQTGTTYLTQWYTVSQERLDETVTALDGVCQNIESWSNKLDALYYSCNVGIWGFVASGAIGFTAYCLDYFNTEKKDRKNLEAKQKETNASLDERRFK